MDIINPQTLQPDQITGNLSHIRFSNDQGFLIGMFQGEKNKGKSKDGEFAALGNMLRPEVGMEYKLFGKWVDDPKWGRQYRFKRYEAIIPKDTDGIYRYLVRVAKWVGPKVGRDLISKYDIDTLDVLREDPERVAKEIKGITINRAEEIRGLLIQNEDIEAALVELERLIGGQGLRQSLPIDLVQKYGSNAPAVLKENPYILTEEKQIGFPSADKVALNRFNVDPASIYRQQSCCLHTIKSYCTQGGHTWIEMTELMKMVYALIKCDSQVGIQKLIDDKRIVMEGKYIALEQTAKDEDFIAKKIKEMLGGVL